jgi:hypothetical protein
MQEHDVVTSGGWDLHAAYIACSMRNCQISLEVAQQVQYSIILEGNFVMQVAKKWMK